MPGPENRSPLKESVGKVLKYTGIIAGILGLLSSNPFIAVGGGTAALYGGNLERKNKK